MSAQFHKILSVAIFFVMQILFISDNSDALEVTVHQFENVWKGSNICKMNPGSYKYKIDDICVKLRGYQYVTANSLFSEARVRQEARCETKKVQVKNGNRTTTKPYEVLMCTLNNQITGKICVTKGKEVKDIITCHYDAAKETCIPFEEKKGVA